MRRAFAAVALMTVAILVAPRADAQDGYAGGWTDPAPTATREDKPLAYLDEAKLLTGQVSHPNGVRSVSVVLVPDADNPPTDGCDAEMDPNVAVEQNGTTATFRVNATFPCNLVYELRATAQANADTGVTGGTPAPHAMPLLLGVAIPPAPVAVVDAILEIDGDDRTVTLEWPASGEPDLLGYVITRTIGDDTETMGQVGADEERTFTDDDPAVGETNRYDVTAVRDGPDDDVEQVASAPTGVHVDVPADTPADEDGEEADPQLAGDATQNDGGAPPDPGALSSVRVRGVQGQPTPPTTADTGFSGTIDYGDVGPEEAVPSGDNAVVAIYDEGTTGSPWSDRETMTFVAGGLAVLSGAGTILTVTRRAARAAY